MLLSLCLNIFVVKIVEVSLNTIVTVLTVKNKKIIATILGFIDVLIWFMIVREALSSNISSIWLALSFASGHAVGTYLGTMLCNKLINEKILMQVVIDKVPKEKIDSIRDKGYAISEIDCTGKNNSKKVMLFIELNNKRLEELKTYIKEIDNNAFMTINETKKVINGFFK